MDNLFEILGPLVIFTIYGIGALLQKIAKNKEEPRTRERNATERREQEQKQQRQYKAAPKDQQEDLMRQLQEALGGSTKKTQPDRFRPDSTRPDSPQPAHRQTTPAPRSEPHREPAPPPLPVSRPEPVRKEQTQWSAPVREHRSSEYRQKMQPDPMRVTKIDKKMQMPIKPIRQQIGAAARIAQTNYGHLSVIQSPSDLQRAILAHEILSPCRAKRRWQRG